jgi:3-deoxy-7-phosphoheptulonate synthase
MHQTTDDVRVTAIRELSPPSHLLREFPLDDAPATTVSTARSAIHRILHGQDDRLLVVIGPCSIHDPKAAREYASRLVGQRRQHAADLEIVMRVYFEKPRTTVGWKGLINDPDLNGSFDVNKGLRTARSLLVDINAMGLPAGTEFLDPISPQYYSDLIAWGAIGARTTESQVHRELASGLSCPLGFKNGTDGNLKIAADAIKSARHSHCFLGVTKGGHSAIVQTSGNEDCHLILRGGQVPNYDAASVTTACNALAANGLAQRLMIDVSHGNSSKQYQRQSLVAADVAAQCSNGEGRIMGVMVESHLQAGRQDIVTGEPLTYGQSVTDACIGWDDTLSLLDTLAAGVRARRCALVAAS